MYRIKELLASGRVLFHTNDLALLLDISNRHSLHVAIHRYLKQGILYSVHRGLYAIRPLDTIDPRLLGMAVIHRYCYLSCERILADEGIIPQQIYGYTFVTSQTKMVTVGTHIFRFRTLADRFLFHPAGVYVDVVGVRMATTARAIADLLYFNPKYALDTHDFIDWKAVKEIQKEVGYL